MHREQKVWLHEVMTGALRKSLQMRHRWRESNWDNLGRRVCSHSDGSEEAMLVCRGLWLQMLDLTLLTRCLVCASN